MRIDAALAVARLEGAGLALGTMRDPARAPVDVLIEALSETGATLAATTPGAARDLPVGGLLSLGVAGAGLQLAHTVRQTPRGVEIAFVTPLPPRLLAQAKAAGASASVAVPQLAIERAEAKAVVPDLGSPRDPTIETMRAPMQALTLTYAATGTVRAPPPAIEDTSAPDARALWLPADATPHRPAVPSPGTWLMVAAAVVAGLVILLL